MQLRGLVRFFTIALILISLYQLSYTWVVNRFEKKINGKAATEIKKLNPTISDGQLDIEAKDKTRYMLDSLQGEKIYNIGVTSSTYQKAKEEQLNLGLDLQGGMNVILQVGLDDLLRNMSNNPKDAALNSAIAAANTAQANSGDDFITLFKDAYINANPNAQLSKLFVKNESNGLTFSSNNNEVITQIRNEAKDAIKRTHKVILTRIDKFGVSQPNVNLDEKNGIISVELAGVTNPERVRKLLQATAKLEFWETYSIHEISQNIVDADKALSNFYAGTKDTSIHNSLKDTTKKVANANGKGDTASLSSLLGKDTKDTSTAGLSTEQKIAKARKENPLRFYFQGGFEVQQDPKTGQPIHQPQISFVQNSDTSALNKLLNLDVVKNIFPKNCKFLYGKAEKDRFKKQEDADKVSVLYAIKKQPGTDNPKLGGEHVTRTGADFDPLTGQPEVTMGMDPMGANIWKKMTGDNVGKGIAIVLDDLVYSAPAPRGEIAGGSSSISGSFSVEEAQDLSNILKTGKLPAPAKIIQEQVVGPTLGEESIKGGIMSFGIAFLVIFGLMLLYYNTAGWVANVALILNLLFTIGVLSALHASLTAAGIAGLVLTIGMAVDTNVIIFERIKEELMGGKSHEVAVEEGYKRSLNPVIDGHVTVLMTAIILFIFGLGPVLGFATTQILGILLSLFCGILVSRLVTDLFTRNGKHLEYFTGISKSIFRGFHFKFIEWRKYAYIISGVVLIAGIASFFNGFDQGVEFSGGRSYTVKLAKEAKNSEVSNALKTIFEVAPIVKKIGSANQVNITTAYKIKDPAISVEQEVQAKLYEGLKAANLIAGGTSLVDFQKSGILSSQTVLPTISDDLKAGAVKATVISIILIFIYIFLRFRKWQYSIGTLVALLHDVFVTLAVFSFFRRIVPFSLEIDQHFIAAILTVIGFSMNDTVIVFDRIREYFRKRPGASKTSVINDAINDTLSRTIMTSLTVFLTLLILFIFGGEVTRGFAFAMLIGVITGTYSSIFVAAPILIDLDKSDALTNEIDKEKKIEELKQMA
jgi:SecD/SecF fusion protein